MRVAFLFVVAAYVAVTEGRLRDGECEVCIKCVNEFMKDMKANKHKKQTAIELGIKDTCARLTNPKDQRLCYYIGGNPDSATGMLRELSGPMKNGMPAEKTCERLKKKDISICELSYPKEIDLSSVDVKKLRVKELKKILKSFGRKCKGCTSKADFVSLVQEIKAEKMGKQDL
mmetsp:Transcript_11925/g.13464  ORF Transcript_11925/g.13464 Transcript_11925/m.13464 type:complete len:173 (-) Transcript_11925:81-599(-)|eukprot:CAMPEP_0205827138 /NCGR_PEP_ID=MMETSP0206-20130828/30986_1 /ASSEMBLY_ACC=CAM_ASM_000279 /TAXON_ID=36767 /ORGANISM="Euplotes focardii, Strain TN1" /LENGTH=172 /DNA_ID=CAMNT_0053127749 /DNA_START=22 /DNA_END=540 /DNA_ORIENTATION=+